MCLCVISQGALCEPDDIIEGVRLVPAVSTAVEHLVHKPGLTLTDFYVARFCLVVLSLTLLVVLFVDNPRQIVRAAEYTIETKFCKAFCVREGKN